MNAITVQQIEADVVITLVNVDIGMVQSHPYWECELGQLELYQRAAQLALAFAEECGGGYVTAHVQDFREGHAQ
jgi:hypothetical protein